MLLQTKAAFTSDLELQRAATGDIITPKPVNRLSQNLEWVIMSAI